MKLLKRFLFMAIAASLCLGCFAPCAGGISALAAGTTDNICMITTTPAEKADTAMNVGFHADIGYTNCYVQYTLKSDTDWANATNQSGTYVTYGADESTNPFYNGYSKDYNGENYYQTNTFHDYSVTLTDLTPATEYKYRVCDGAKFSDTYYFKTAGAEEWSFVVTGDFHVYYTSTRADKATTAINAAIALAKQQSLPAVEHIVSIGDIVAWGVAYNQWQLLTSQPYFKQYSFANCIGNHDDMDRFGNSTSAYNAICFNNPKNGYGDEIGTCYYYLYNDVLFIYINYLDPSAEAEAWATQVVNSMAGKYKYSVLVNHRPATNKYTGGTYSYFWNYWADFCDTHKIDLVLAGDHHVYMRSHPLNNGNIVSDYSATKPDGTVYIAADSSDGDRGSSTDVVSSWDDIVASHYYRYEYSGSSADITSMLITVKEDKLTAQFVYYESNATAAHPSFREGSVNGHAGFYYGDTSYIYPSDHSTPAGGGEVVEGTFPSDAVNLLDPDLNGSYKYTETVYPGGSSYYGTAYYGDNSSQGTDYMSGKLNDGVYAANSNPGSSNKDWAVFFKSGGAPDITFKLNDEATVYGLAVNYRGYTSGSFYSGATVDKLYASTNGTDYTEITGYTVSSEITNGDNYDLNVVFDDAITAKYIRLVLTDPDNDASRYAMGEVKVMGNADWVDTVGGTAGTYIVEFKDHEGNVISTQNVKGGSSAVPPALPLRSGYYFVGWDKDYNNVSEALVVTAMYSDGEDEVIFLDHDGTELSRQTVAFGSAATPPADPEREEYVFTGWDKPFDAIAGDTVITATYVHESEIDKPDDDKEIIPIPQGDNILLSKPYTTVFNQYLNATVADNDNKLLTDGRYRGDGTNPWGITYGITVEYAGSAQVNSANFEFDTATDVAVIVFKNVRITGNRGFAVDSVSYSTDGSNYQDAKVKVAQVTVEGANENVYYEIRVIVDLKAVKGIKIAWTNNGEYVSQFDELEAYASYAVQGEEEPVKVNYGDVNGDGKVNSLDAAQVLKHDAMMITLEEGALTAADVNADGKVNSLDAAQILKYDALIIDKFPAEQ